MSVSKRVRAVVVGGALLGAILAPATAASADPAKAAVTVRSTVTRGSHSQTLRLSTLGPPPKAPASLVDETGRHVIAVTALPDSASCKKAPLHDTGLGTDEWCFTLKGVETGATFKGDLVGADVVVSVTVTARNGIGYPAAVCALALLFAILLAWASTKLLPSLVTRLLFWGACCNDDGVDGLAEWAKQAVTNGRLSQSDALSRVRWAKGAGKRQLFAARHALGALLADPAIPPCPLRTDAQAEANASTVARKDLLTDAGTRAQSAAERIEAVVAQASDAIAAFAEVSATLLARIPTKDPNHATGVTLIDQTKHVPDAYLSEFTLDQIKGEFQDALTELRGYVASAGVTAPSARPMALLGTIISGPVASLVGTQSGDLRNAAASAVATTAALGMVLVIAAAAMLVAVAAVLATQYFPNQTFGTLSDYALLAITTAGSSAAAAIVTRLALVRGPTAWYA